MSVDEYDDWRAAVSDPETFLREPFHWLRTLAHRYEIAAAASDAVAVRQLRDLIIRCVEYYDRLGSAATVLDALLGRLGLYPYLRERRAHLSMSDLLALETARPLAPPASMPDLVFHASQAEAYARLMEGENVILSAPTSFGKSLLIDAALASGRYKTIVVIVPTLALIDEARRRLNEFRREFAVVTRAGQRAGDRTVMVLTQERVLEFDEPPAADLVVVDEFYKLSPTMDEERGTLLNQAFVRLLRASPQFLLLGPTIGGVVRLPENITATLLTSADSTVAIDRISVDTSCGREDALVRLVRELVASRRGGTLIFCSSPKRATRAVRLLVDAGIEAGGWREASQWVEREIASEWTLADGLRCGVGLHHGRVPRALGHAMVEGFNADRLGVLVCTSTLIEGVNTKAKHVIVYDNTIKRRALDVFTFRNIEGRSGRLFKHVVGHIYLFDEAPHGDLPEIDIPGLTQSSEAAPELLLEIVEEDRTEQSKKRLEPYLEQDVLPIDVLRRHHGVRVDDLLTLGKRLHAMPHSELEDLCWSETPHGDQLRKTMELVWDSFPVARDKGRWGASSASQLATLTSLLSQAPTARELIAKQWEYWSTRNRSFDDVVDSVLKFIRTGAGHAVPRHLRATNEVVRVVARRRDIAPGDWSAYAARVESLFVPFPLAILDEYGLPVEVGMRLRRRLVPRGDETLDDVLERLRELPDAVVTDAFERYLLREVKSGL